jgi:predicted TIM-barrel fold metal-dependent hydrolase
MARAGGHGRQVVFAAETPAAQIHISKRKIILEDIMRAKAHTPSLEFLKPFDSSVSLGRIVLPGQACFPTAESLLAMMDRYGIAEALVHEYHARVVHPRAHGTLRLMELIRGQDRLHPVWVIQPPEKPGAKPAQALVAEMLAAGVHAARLPMKFIPPLPWLWDDLCAVLEQHRIPCFLDFGETSTIGSMSDHDVNCVREIALAHPKLPLVLSGIMGGLGVHPGVVPMIRRVPNVYLDICGILEFWRKVALEVGPERVLFATCAPFVDPGILLYNVQYEHRLDEKAKKLIYGDNLRQLLKAVTK